jgi:hypothetical protein
MPADLRLGPRLQPRGCSGQPRTFGVLVWPAVGSDLRQPFSSPCRGVMGSGRNPQNGRQGPGLKCRGALFILIADRFGSTQPIRARL